MEGIKSLWIFSILASVFLILTALVYLEKVQLLTLNIPSLNSITQDHVTDQSPYYVSITQGLSIHMVIVPFLHFTNVSTEKILAREAEYKYVLQNNLNHPLVQCVHVLTTNYTNTFKKFKDLKNGSKLLIKELHNASLTRVPFEYISHNLVGEDAMYANADIYLGGGFELVDAAVMNRNKIMYALTRRVKPEERCGESRSYTDTDKCLEAPYIGSHDVFLFHLNESLPDTFLKELEFKLPSLGMESVLMWLFKHKLGYCILNPCTILESFHYHCSDVRSRILDSKSNVHVNNPSNTEKAPFTTDLYCSRGHSLTYCSLMMTLMIGLMTSVFLKCYHFNL